MHPPVRVLLVDDFSPFRDLLRTDLQLIPGLEIVGEASNGLEAIHKFRHLRPNLILLDIGLPELNGLEVARRITTLSPQAKILIVSENRTREIVMEAFRSGATGYLVKFDVPDELRIAMESVLAGVKFISKIAMNSIADDGSDFYPARDDSRQQLTSTNLSQLMPSQRHHAGLYSDDQALTNHAGLFIANSLQSGNAAIVIATPSHRSKILSRLKACNVDVEAVSEQRRLLTIDAGEVIARITVDERVDHFLFMNFFDGLVSKAKIRHLRIAVFGECAPILLTRGNAGAAIQLEQFGNELLQICNVEILCGYSSSSLQKMAFGNIYHQICVEHSCIHSH